MGENKEYENDIRQDAYYLIKKFKDDGKSVTNLQIQKLMYFFEAYYMNVYDVDELYDCNFCAWAYGPVAIPLYKELKKFGNGNIELTEENIERAEKVSEDKKNLLDKIYNVFKDVAAMTLVDFTHMTGSPWKDVWERNGRKVGYGADTYINKIKTKEWFRDVFQKRT